MFITAWEFTSDKPIHVQIISEISHRIISGKYELGSKLPSVRDLAAEASVNPNTMQKALSALETGGLIYSERTSGRFVTNNMTLIEKAKEELAVSYAEKFLSSMEGIGYGKEDSMEILNRIKEVNTDGTESGSI